MTGFSTAKLIFDGTDDWDETQKYYEEFIYYDRYGIFDFMIDKSNLATYISDLYLYETEIGLHFFVKNMYYFENNFMKEKNERKSLLKALEYIHIHMKRGNLIMRVNIDIKKRHIKDFNINNVEEMVNFMLEEYERQTDKKDFLEYGIGIRLSDSAKINRIHI